MNPARSNFLAFAALLVAAGTLNAQSWSIPAEAPLLTRWAKTVRPERVLPEYPRPQLVRTDWLNLNGIWEYAPAAAAESPPFGKQLSGRILVPFPVESALSGVMKHIDQLWYRKEVTIPGSWKGRGVVLHFGAVDWETVVFVNGVRVGDHRGGYDPFSLDITSALHDDRPQEILLRVEDSTDTGNQPRGKQVLKPGGIWYTPTTGIWQTVWLEPIPQAHIDGLVITPDLDGRQVLIRASASGTHDDARARVIIRAAGKQIAAATITANTDTAIGISDLRPWSPDTPFLYDLSVSLVQEKMTVDSVGSYFGMRKVSIGKDARGITRILLNNRFVMQVGPLDQGFWPDGLYTAPTDAALRSDLEMTRKLGFNMTRKHVKVEPDRWYYWADKLGLLVWQDMPSANNRTPGSRVQFEHELEALVRTHRNHPCIVMWVIFNEGWGQYDTERLTAWVKQLDPARLVNSASGWDDKNAGDVCDLHHYPSPKAPPAESSRAIVLGEFGGLGLAVPGHTWKTEHWGYQGMSDGRELTERYVAFLDTVYLLRDHPGLSAAVYTQITDVEVECNGLLTYDRKLSKPDLRRVVPANEGHAPRKRNSRAR